MPINQCQGEKRMRIVKWKPRRGFVKRKKHSFTWGVVCGIRFRMVILYVRYLRYKGWEIWQLTDAYGEGWVIWQRPDRRDGMQRRKIKGSDPSSPGAVHLAALESNILEKYPRLLEHMAVTRLEDGSARSPGTVLWKTLGSSWVIVLKEPD